MSVCIFACPMVPGCDGPDDAAGGSSQPGEVAPRVEDESLCWIADDLRPPTFAMVIEDEPQAELLDSSSESGQLHVTLSNSSDAPIEAALTLLVHAGATEAVALPSTPVPANGSVEVPIDV